MYTTSEDTKIKEITHLIQDNKATQEALQYDFHHKEEQLQFETAELEAQIENSHLQLEGIAIDTQYRDANMMKLLAESNREGGLSSVEQVEGLTETEVKVHLKLMLIDNANLVADATLFTTRIEDLQLRIKEKEEMVQNLEIKLTSLVE